MPNGSSIGSGSQLGKWELERDSETRVQDLHSQVNEDDAQIVAWLQLFVSAVSAQAVFLQEQLQVQSKNLSRTV